MSAELQAVKTRRLVFAGLIGNTMEWYDFSVYGYLAAIIAPQFFPSSSAAVSLIAAFGTFAAGFLVQPLGGLVFGRIGDLMGRRRALVLSVMAMAVWVQVRDGLGLGAVRIQGAFNGQLFRLQGTRAWS